MEVLDTTTVRIRAVCKGDTPLLMDAMTEQRIRDELMGRLTSEQFEQLPQEEQCRRRLVINPATDQPALTGEMIMACLRDAGRYAKIDQYRSITAANGETKIHIVVQDVPDFVELSGPRQWVVDNRKAKDPQTGRKRAVYRPKFVEWGFEITFNADLDTLGLHHKLVREIFIIAGKIGVGAFRPGLKGYRIMTSATRITEGRIYPAGSFGRFHVADWQVLPNGK
jgi:hypothetical protein